MTKKTFCKELKANDIGTTGGHQAGIHIPKSQTELLKFLPALDGKQKNPDAWIECRDEGGNIRRLRFIHYNNKLHDPNGTRDEYRLTHLTGFFREERAQEGDAFEISKGDHAAVYSIRVVRKPSEQAPSPTSMAVEEPRPRIKISGWRKIH